MRSRPAAADAPPPAVPNPYTVNLNENIERLKLDVRQIAALHGPRVATMADLRTALDRRRIRTKSPASGPFFPDATEVDDHLDRLFHVLRRHPLEPRVEVVLAGEEVRRRQSHERQPRAVGAAADRALVGPRGRRGGSLRARARRPRDAGRAPPSCCGTAPRSSTSTRAPGIAAPPPRARAARPALPCPSGPPSRSRGRCSLTDVGRRRRCTT